jgi:hypothetical protein
MRRLLRLLGTRYGVSLGLVVMVVAIVLVAKALGGESRPMVGGDPAPASSPTASFEPDDGEASPPAPIAPSVSAGASDPSAVAVAFTKAWLHHAGVSAQDWYNSLARYATDDLRSELTDVDPAGVPASSITGNATLTPHDVGYAVVTVPVDSGVVTLRMLGTDGRWLVDGVDWTRT